MADTRTHEYWGCTVTITSDAHYFTAYTFDNGVERPIGTVTRPRQNETHWTAHRTNGELVGRYLSSLTAFRRLVQHYSHS